MELLLAICILPATASGSLLKQDTRLSGSNQPSCELCSASLSRYRGAKDQHGHPLPAQVSPCYSCRNFVLSLCPKAVAAVRRYMYGETLGRWRTADLLIGLAYLARREREEHPVADIARCGHILGSERQHQREQDLVSFARHFCLCPSHDPTCSPAVL